MLNSSSLKSASCGAPHLYPALCCSHACTCLLYWGIIHTSPLFLSCSSPLLLARLLRHPLASARCPKYRSTSTAVRQSSAATKEGRRGRKEEGLVAIHSARIILMAKGVRGTSASLFAFRIFSHFIYQRIHTIMDFKATKPL